MTASPELTLKELCHSLYFMIRVNFHYPLEKYTNPALNIRYFPKKALPQFLKKLTFLFISSYSLLLLLFFRFTKDNLFTVKWWLVTTPDLTLLKYSEFSALQDLLEAFCSMSIVSIWSNCAFDAFERFSHPSLLSALAAESWCLALAHDQQTLILYSYSLVRHLNIFAFGRVLNK